MTIQRFALPVPGGKLCGDVQGDGPAVVLLHGFTLDRRAWDSTAPGLAAHGFRVVRLDLRGHGESSDAAAPYAAADEVPRVLDALGLARAVLVGLSWGGQVALDTALVHPGRVRGLVLVDATLPGHDYTPDWRALVARLRALAQGPEGPKAAAHAWFADALFAPARAHAETRAAFAAWETARAGRLWAGRDLALPAQPPAARRLHEVHAPTLVVVGENDRADFRAIAHALAAGIPGARLAEIAGAGHLPNLEAPERFVPLVARFLAGLPAA